MRPTTHNIRAKLALHDKIHPQNVQNPRAINLRGRTGAISHPTHLRIRAKHGTGKPVRLILEPRVELLKTRRETLGERGITSKSGRNRRAGARIRDSPRGLESEGGGGGEDKAGGLGGVGSLRCV